MLLLGLIFAYSAFEGVEWTRNSVNSGEPFATLSRAKKVWFRFRGGFPSAFRSQFSPFRTETFVALAKFV